MANQYDIYRNMLSGGFRDKATSNPGSTNAITTNQMNRFRNLGNKNRFRQIMTSPAAYGSLPTAPVNVPKFVDRQALSRNANKTMPKGNVSQDGTPPNFKNNLLDFVVGDEGQALARGLLEDSGYSLMPKTLGESLAKGMGYMEQVEGNQLDKELKELQIKAAKKELETTATTKKEIKKLADGFLYYVDPTGKTPPERVDPSQVENTDEKDLKAEEKDFKQANDLRDEHTKNSGEFIKVRDAYGRILASGTNPSPAGDLALIFNYMKMLDPGSTVREGEFANAQNSGSIPDWIWARYNNVLEGTRLAPPQRKDFLDRSESLYDAAKDTQLFLDESYKDLAKEFNVDASKVVIDFDKPIREKKFKYKLETYSIDELLKLDISGFDERQKELYLSILDQKEKGLK
tara:strand:+ start:1626 stop:2834 length:1209 start_codon:yes stop_codon:yes gene_type:complete